MTARPWMLRAFEAVRDASEVQRIDTSYTTRASYRVRSEGSSLVLEWVAASAPCTKVYAIDLAADAWQHARVAVLDGKVCGFIAWAEQPWNRRLVIWHYYVDAPYRRLGGGRLLMNAALDWAVQRGLVTAWVETSNTNQPGIETYRRLGFEICGFDTTLYRGSDTDDEFAIYLARAIDEPGRDRPTR